MSRPQVGIDRLPARRASTEPRESMNCKSCRKRKIKCNRLRPTCEACQVFACPCIYDAVPKKRGPKTDVLEALLKRVDGLEKQLHKETKDKPKNKNPEPEDFNTLPSSTTAAPPTPKPVLTLAPSGAGAAAAIPPSDLRPQQPQVHLADVLLDTYFARIHGRPYFILDELTTRQRLQHHQLPSYLAHAIYAVSSRYASHPGGYTGAVRAGEEHAAQARIELDTDEPSIEGLQTLLLLSQANYQSGRGKKAYMLLSTAISMALALELHRELPMIISVPPSEREGRRRLFWACYLMDRFAACGSKRPSLITDESVMLRLPSSACGPNSMLLEGDFFRNGSNSNLQYMAGPGKQSQSSSVMLIGIARILGITNRYLAAGGVKGDSHFPWHSLSNLSKIRHELDMWAAETQDTFSSLETLFGHSDSTMLVLSKLIYHLIHCLIYRPFLPMDLAELSVTGQHQSWQIEATNLCFLHANAIAELVEIGRASSISIIDWPAFVGYCIGTAGTIHVHGAHYRGREGEVYSTSAELLTREMNQLADLRFIWAGVQHQRDTLQWVYGCHSELIKTLAGNGLRFSGVLEFEDFFDRYPGHAVDGAHVTFADLTIEPQMLEGISLYTQPTHHQNHHQQQQNQPLPFLPPSAYPHPHLQQQQQPRPPLVPSQPQNQIQPHLSSPLDAPRRRKRRSTIATATTAPVTLSTTSPAPASAHPLQSGDAAGRLRRVVEGVEGEVEGIGMEGLQAFQQQVIAPFSPGFGFGGFEEGAGGGSNGGSGSGSVLLNGGGGSGPGQHGRQNSSGQARNQNQKHDNGTDNGTSPSPNDHHSTDTNTNTDTTDHRSQNQNQDQDPTPAPYDPMFSIPTPYNELQRSPHNHNDDHSISISPSQTHDHDDGTPGARSGLSGLSGSAFTGNSAFNDTSTSAFNTSTFTNGGGAPFSDPGGFTTDNAFDTAMSMSDEGGEGGGSQDGEKDPFLALLEQLAENEGGRGGVSELDFFLGA